MARVRPEPWDDEQRGQAIRAMTSFAVSGDDGKLTMCALMDCAPVDLDWQCKQAFGLTFANARTKYERIGRARVLTAIFQVAESGKNAKMLELVARISGLDAVAPQPRGRKPNPKPEPKQEEVDF